MPGFEVLIARFIATSTTKSKKVSRQDGRIYKIRMKPATSELVLNTKMDLTEAIPCNDSEIVNLNVTIKEHEEKVRKASKIKTEEDQIRIFKCGMKYYALTKYQHARIFFESVLDYNQFNSNAWNYLGLICEKENDLLHAQQLFQIALEVDETNIEANTHLQRINQVLS